MLWAVFTLIAAAGQTARNAMQRELTTTLGTVGATHVRFLFGFPFAVLFLIGVLIATKSSLPNPPLTFWAWIVFGGLAQITATALMLVAMGERSFVVAVAYIKTEPVQVALFGLIFLHDALTPSLAIAVVVATIGVIVMSLKPGAAASAMSVRPTVYGLLSGTAFALSAVGYRGAILSLQLPNFVLAATFTLAVGLIWQSVVLSAYLAIRDVGVLRAIMREWKPSMLAGFMGSFASEFWFLAFAIATAASVRTLALVEVLMAQGVSKFIFKQPATPREVVGIVLTVIGVIILVSGI
jgi:drug/metabolite transporter (DMT)-like permease